MTHTPHEEREGTWRIQYLEKRHLSFPPWESWGLAYSEEAAKETLAILREKNPRHQWRAVRLTETPEPW